MKISSHYLQINVTGGSGCIIKIPGSAYEERQCLALLRETENTGRQFRKLTALKGNIHIYSKGKDIPDHNFMISWRISGAASHICGVALHICGVALHICGVASHICGVALHISGVALHISGVALHISGVDLHISGVALQISGVALHIPNIGVSWK